MNIDNPKDIDNDVKTEKNNPNGILLINKPKDWTSFDCVAKIRGILRSATGIKKIKVGHSGTLDPLATGVLPIFIGKATKTIPMLENKNKEYIADFKLGMTTNTLDITGEITSETPLPENLSGEELKHRINEILPKFKGKILQEPPMYSAVKVDGVRLYKLARKGIEVERKPREVEIYELELIEKYGEDFGEKHGKDFGEECGELAILSETNGEMPYKFKLKIWCTSGTYVRVLIDDIGRELGFGAVMTDLVRTKSNGFEIENCVEISNLNRENIFGYINS